MKVAHVVLPDIPSYLLRIDHTFSSVRYIPHSAISANHGAMRLLPSLTYSISARLIVNFYQTKSSFTPGKATLAECVDKAETFWEDDTD